MKRITILTALVLGTNVSVAQDEENIRALFDQYLALFSAAQSKEIAEEIVAEPAFYADQMTQNASEMEMRLERYFAEIKGRGWSYSTPISIDVCVIGDGLALVEQNFTRFDNNGAAIPPTVRGAFYVLRRLDVGWRMVAVYEKDPGVDVSCT